MPILWASIGRSTCSSLSLLNRTEVTPGWIDMDRYKCWEAAQTVAITRGYLVANRTQSTQRMALLKWNMNSVHYETVFKSNIL